MSWFKRKQKEVNKLGLVENYAVETESEEYVIMSSKLRGLTHQEALQEFDMLLSEGYLVLGWWNNPYTLLCRKVKQEKIMRNCKKGDMAIVVSSQAGNAGKIVTCLELVGNADGCSGKDVWLIDRELLHNDGIMKPYIRDSQLMPISPSDDQISEFSSEDDKEIDFEIAEFYGNTLALVPKRKEGA